MALKIRLRQQGRNNRRTFRLVVIESKQRRDGAYVECLGWYDPRRVDVNDGVGLKADRIEHWLQCGAQLTEKAEVLIGHANPELGKKIAQDRLARKLNKKQKKKQSEAIA